MDFKRQMEVKRDKQRIIELLKSKGITQLESGEKVDDLSLMTLSILENNLNR